MLLCVEKLKQLIAQNILSLRYNIRNTLLTKWPDKDIILLKVKVILRILFKVTKIV